MIAALALLLVAEAFAIGGQAFTQSEILDARGVPEADGRAAVHITFDPAVAARLETVTRAHLGKPLAVTLDGALLAAPIIAEPVASGEMTIPAGATIAEADALALRIAGKPPLPDEFEE
jgi:preprotein translocase subunit SecD